MIIDQPILGVGLRGFEYRYPEYAKKLYESPIEKSAAQSHNLLLSFWVNTGIFGLLGVFLLFCWAFRRRYSSHSLTWALLTIFTTGLLDTPYWRLDLSVMFWLYVSIIAADDTKKI
jgi:O-antigen ligase